MSLAGTGDPRVFTPSSFNPKTAHLAYRNNPAWSVAVSCQTLVLGSFPTVVVLTFLSLPCLARSRPRERCLKSSHLLKAVK
ncbi:hypothetical protein Nmel_017169 [Mimus melanotis]